MRRGTWSDLLELLEAELDRLVASAQAAAVPERQEGFFLRANDFLVDRAVRLFSNRGCWPDLSQKERLAVQQRLSAALVFLRAVQAARTVRGQWLLPQTIPDVPQNELLQWLLIDQWQAQTGSLAPAETFELAESL